MSRKINIKWIIQLVLILWLSFHIRHHARITPRRHWAGEYTSTRSLIEGKPRVICCSVIPATNHKILMLLRWPDLSIPGEESRTMSPSVPSHHPPLLLKGSIQTYGVWFVAYTQTWCLCCPNKGGCEAVIPDFYLHLRYSSLYLSKFILYPTSCSFSSIMSCM